MAVHHQGTGKYAKHSCGGNTGSSVTNTAMVTCADCKATPAFRAVHTAAKGAKREAAEVTLVDDGRSYAPLLNAMVGEYVTMTRNGSRPYANGYGAAIVMAAMVAWGVDEESAAERIDEMITAERERRASR